MSKQQKLRTHWCLLGGVVLAITYWFIESILHLTIFHGGDLSTELLPLDDVNEMWMRLLIAAMFVSFGIVMDTVLMRLRHAHQDRGRLVEQLEKSLAEVKTLSGLLPICAVCKKIRDDSGYWHQVESYVSDRSDADFSHGYCPDCAETALRVIRKRGQTHEEYNPPKDSGNMK